MKISKHSLAVAAAFAGLAGGTAARAAQPGGSVLSAGLFADANYAKKQIEKHACKGLNSCKGMGGGDASQWGKNDCKGKGACATDGSKPKPKGA